MRRRQPPLDDGVVLPAAPRRRRRRLHRQQRGSDRSHGRVRAAHADPRPPTRWGVPLGRPHRQRRGRAGRRLPLPRRAPPAGPHGPAHPAGQCGNSCAASAGDERLPGADPGERDAGAGALPGQRGTRRHTARLSHGPARVAEARGQHPDESARPDDVERHRQVAARSRPVRTSSACRLSTAPATSVASPPRCRRVPARHRMPASRFGIWPPSRRWRRSRPGGVRSCLSILGSVPTPGP